MIEDCKAGKIDMIKIKSISKSTLDTLNSVITLKELALVLFLKKKI
jgi:hypothetical protein